MFVMEESEDKIQNKEGDNEEGKDIRELGKAKKERRGIRMLDL